MRFLKIIGQTVVNNMKKSQTSSSQVKISTNFLIPQQFFRIQCPNKHFYDNLWKDFYEINDYLQIFASIKIGDIQIMADLELNVALMDKKN